MLKEAKRFTNAIGVIERILSPAHLTLTNLSLEEVVQRTSSSSGEISTRDVVGAFLRRASVAQKLVRIETFPNSIVLIIY